VNLRLASKRRSRRRLIAAASLGTLVAVLCGSSAMRSARTQVDPAIVTRVRRIVTEQLSVADSALDNDRSLILDYGADSLDQVEIVLEIASEFRSEAVRKDDAEVLCGKTDATVRSISEWIARNGIVVPMQLKPSEPRRSR